jgi:hypothetical protein
MFDKNTFKNFLAKSGKKNIFLFRRAWRALRPFGFAQDMLCASHVFSDSVGQY